MKGPSATVLFAAVLAIGASCTGTTGRTDGGGGLPGGGGGQGGGAGGNGGGGGLTGSAGSIGGGGSGGGAGQGAGGGGGFACAGATLGGDCSSFPVGLVCLIAGEAEEVCTCLPGTGGPFWQCGGSSTCPSTAPGSGPACSSSTASTIANFGGCKYPPSEVCRCDVSGAGAAWSCDDVSCPAGPPTETCSTAVHPANFHCLYSGGARDCACIQGDGATSRWICNGQPTPDCPPAWPGSSADCSTFAAGTVCSYAVGNFSGGPCACTTEGATQTWQCSGG